MTKSTILVVEDEGLVGMELTETLERFGYSVPAVLKRGEEVLNAVVLYKPDLILMDIRLKGFQDGIETAYMVGGEFDVPFVFVSAYSDDETLSRALGTKAYGYLVKPFDERTLRTTVELALKRGREDRSKFSDNWYKMILTRFPRTVFLTDIFGRITFANDAAKAMFPARAGLAGITAGSLFSGADFAASFLDVVSASASKAPAMTGRTALADGGAPVIVETAAFHDDSGAVTGFVMLVENANPGPAVTSPASSRT